MPRMVGSGLRLTIDVKHQMPLNGPERYGWCACGAGTRHRPVHGGTLSNHGYYGFCGQAMA